MTAIHITHFAGLRPELNSRLKPVGFAQIAHNCLLTDGSLRPMAQWVEITSGSEYSYKEQFSISYDDRNKLVCVNVDSTESICLNGEPFAKGLILEVSPGESESTDGNSVGTRPTAELTEFDGRQLAGIYSHYSGSISYTRSYDSNKPVNRLYATTATRISGGKVEESPLYLLPGQAPTDIVYEGDLVEISLSLNDLGDGVTNYRLYRSMTGLDTGENVTNVMDTNWHLVADLPSYATTYVDGASATAAPLDVCYSQNFHPPVIDAVFLGLTESGWFIIAGYSGHIQVSERYMHHAWPVEGHMQLQGETVTDMAVFRDNAYIGTEKFPYLVAVSQGELAVQLSATPFPEAIPCLPGTMAASASGAIYASGQGLVSLSRDGQRLLTKEVCNAGDILYKKTVPEDEEQEIPAYTIQAKIGNTGYGAYHLGNYFGFCIPPVQYYGPPPA